MLIDKGLDSILDQTLKKLHLPSFGIVSKSNIHNDLK